MSYIVVLELTGPNRDGDLRQYVSPDVAQAALDRFGHAEAAEEVTDEQGTRWVVSCADQRGDRGAYRLHSIACNYGIPVYCE